MDQRFANLRCALAALRIKQDEPELQLHHRVFDTWSGIGLLAVGMRRQGLRLSLTHVADHEWRRGSTCSTAPVWPALRI